MLTNREIINLVHILLVSILFIYIGTHANFTPIVFYYVLLVLGILLVIGHTYFLLKKPKYNKLLYIIHVLIVAPLLFALFFYKHDSPEWLYDIITVLGIIVFLYHGVTFSNNFKIKRRI